MQARFQAGRAARLELELLIRAYMMRTHLAVPALYIVTSIAGNFIAAPVIAELQSYVGQFNPGLPAQ